MWYLSPSGWPTFAASLEEQASLVAAGYVLIDESQVSAAVAAYEAGSPPPVPADFVTVDELQTATSPARAALGAAFEAKRSVSIEQYGAIAGDNDTNAAANTTAIQNAISNAVTYGFAVTVPPKVYRCNGITLKPGVVLQGLNGQGYYNATTTVPNPSLQSVLKLASGATAPLISPDDSGNKATHCRIRDLALDCNGLAQPAVSLPDQGTSISRFWILDRVYMVNNGATSGATGANQHMAYIGNQNTAVTMRDCILFNGTSGSPAGYNGLGWYGSDGRADNVYIGYFGNVGLNLFGGTADETFTWRGGGIFTCGGANVALGGGGAVFEGTSFDHGQVDGVYINNGPATFLGCTFHGNSASGPGNNSDIHVAGSNVDVTVIGCRNAGGGTTPKNFINVTGTGVTLRQFGNSNEAGTAFTNGWVNYTPTSAQADAIVGDLGIGRALASPNGPGTLPSGAIVETVSRKLLTSSAVNGGSGTLRGVLVHLEAGTVVTSLTWQAGATALASGTHQWFAVLDTTGKVLAVTSDDTSTAWAANATKTLNLTSPLTIPATGGYYLAHCVVATTIPTHFGIVATVPPAAPFVSAVASGQTTPPAVGTTLTLTSSSNVDYGWAS